MIDHARCQRSDELIDLVDGPAETESTADLRRHVAACPTCRPELALLQEGFRAMGPAQGPADELALRRIESRVMPAILSDLARGERLPVPALAPAGRRLFRLGALAAGAVVPAAVLWMKLGDTLLQPGRALVVALMPLLLLPALLLPTRLRGAALLIGIGVTAGATLTALFGVDLPLHRGAPCTILGASGWLLPAIAVFVGAPASRNRGDDATGLLLGGALRGAAVGTGGVALQRAFCGISGTAHALLFHLGPFFFLLSLCALAVMLSTKREIEQPS